MTVTERLVVINTAEALLREQERQLKIALLENVSYHFRDIIEYGPDSDHRRRGIVVHFELMRDKDEAMVVPYVFPLLANGKRTDHVKPVAVPATQLHTVAIIKRAESRWI